MCVQEPPYETTWDQPAEYDEAEEQMVLYALFTFILSSLYPSIYMCFFSLVVTLSWILLEEVFIL